MCGRAYRSAEKTSEGEVHEREDVHKLERHIWSEFFARFRNGGVPLEPAVATNTDLVAVDIQGRKLKNVEAYSDHERNLGSMGLGNVPTQARIRVRGGAVATDRTEAADREGKRSKEQKHF